MQRILFAAVFTLPLALFIAFDVLWQGRTYGVEYNDAAAGGYGAGLDWLTGRAWPTPYHPAYLFHQATALLVWLAGRYPKDLNTFQAGVLALNLLVQFLAGLWAAGAARRLGLGLLDAALLGVMLVTMPSTLAFASQWTPYAWLASILTAFGIVFVELWLSESNPRSRWWSAGIGLGFLAGFYFPALALVIPIAAATIARGAASAPHVANQWLGFGDRPPTTRLWVATYLMFGLTIAALGTLYTCFTLYPEAEIYNYKWRQLFLSFFAAQGATIYPMIAIFFLVRALGRHGVIVAAVTAPILVGWWAAANVMAPYWRVSAEGALGARSGIGGIPWADLASRIAEHHWMVLLALSGVALLIVALRAVLRADWPTALLGAAAIAACGLNVLAAARTMAETRALSMDPGQFGQGPRVMICVLFAIAIAYVLLRRYPRPWPQVAMAAIVLTACASLWQDFTVLGPATQRVRADVEKINAAATAHLSAADQNRLLCVRSRIPEDCAMAYAFDHARYPPARAISSPPPVREGAVCYIRIPPATCDDAERMWREAGCAERRGRMMVSQELVPDEPSPASTVMDGNFFWMRQNIRMCPAI